MVGKSGEGREILYARQYWSSTRYMGHQLVVYDAASAASGAFLSICPSSHVNGLYVESYALVSPGSSQEGVVAPTDGDASALFLGLSATGNSGAPQSQTVSTSLKDGGQGNTMVRGAFMFFGNSGQATSVMTGSGNARSGWPVSSVSPGGVNAMALSGDTVVLGEGDASRPLSVGGISTVSVDGGKATIRYLGGPVAAPVVGQGGMAFGVDLKAGQLVRALLTSSGSFLSSKETALDATLPPTLGQGGLVYALFTSDVGVWSASDLSLQWKWSGASVPAKSKRVAPTLDCTRDSLGVPLSGRPGVLYATLHNRVTALVVDSAGLDADAPWPKFQHDERNSGNPAVPILRCP